jgi:hypothetical protein
MLTIARTTKLTPQGEKIEAEDEAARGEAEKEAAQHNLSEMQDQVGGSCEEAEAEEEATVDRTNAMHIFETEELRAMLFREREVAEGKKKGPKTHRRANEALR